MDALESAGALTDGAAASAVLTRAAPPDHSELYVPADLDDRALGRIRICTLVRDPARAAVRLRHCRGDATGLVGDDAPVGMHHCGLCCHPAARRTDRTSRHA